MKGLVFARSSVSALTAFCQVALVDCAALAVDRRACRIATMSVAL
jgi:hypothetical protein